MKTILKAAAMAAVIGTTAFGAAKAADIVVFDPGTVAYGYNDGYWTNKREWRAWDKPEYVETYRKYPNARYYDYKHDRDPDMGWRGEIVIK